VATRFTRATVAFALLRARLRPAPALRPPRLLREEDFRAADLRPPLRRADDLRPPRDDLRVLLDRFRAAPRFRPEDFFLPPLERLDFLAAAMDKLRVAGFVRRIARFAHNVSGSHGAVVHDAR